MAVDGLFLLLEQTFDLVDGILGSVFHLVGDVA